MWVLKEVSKPILIRFFMYVNESPEDNTCNTSSIAKKPILKNIYSKSVKSTK